VSQFGERLLKRLPGSTIGFACVSDFAVGCGIDWQIAKELAHKDKARIVRRIAPSTSDKGYYRED
jgi:hypothetical protein